MLNRKEDKMFDVTRYNECEPQTQYVMLADGLISKNPSDTDLFGGVAFAKIPVGTDYFFAGSLLTKFGEGGFDGAFFCVSDDAILTSSNDCRSMSLRSYSSDRRFELSASYSDAWLDEWRALHWNMLYDADERWTLLHSKGRLEFDLAKLDTMTSTSLHALPYHEYLGYDWAELFCLLGKFSIPHWLDWLPNFKNRLRKNSELYAA